MSEVDDDTVSEDPEAPENPEYHITTSGGIASTHTAISPEGIRVAPTTGEEFNTIRPGILPRACWRIDDVRFAFASSFVNPDASDEFRDLAILVKAHPDSPLSIFGHADPVGQDAFNKELSGRRAVSVYAILTRNVALLENLYSNPHGNDDWTTSTVKTMLLACGYTPGPAGSELDDATRDALEAFQNANGLAATRDPGQPTRTKLFEAYMDVICRDDAGRAFKLQPTDFLGRGSDPDGKADYQGCGEFNPRLLFSRAENQRFAASADKTERNRENAPNRRVMIYLFQPGLEIEVDRWPCPRASENQAGCRARFWSDHQRRRSFQAERREFETSGDTFACRFYHRLASQSPCERGEIMAMECSPTLFTIEQPGATNHVRMHSLWAYVVHFAPDGDALDRVQRYSLVEGRLTDPATGTRLVMECDREAHFYFSHRDDLLGLDHGRYFRKDGSGLPLLGPFAIPRGPDARLELDIWQQQDWVIVRGNRVDGARPDGVKMCEWRENYQIGRLLPFADGSGIGFFPHGDHRQKEAQEQWRGGAPIDLVHLGNPGSNPMWAGTLSALPSDKAKLLLLHNGPGGEMFAGSYNEIVATGANQDLPGHHQYDAALVGSLLALPASDQSAAAIAALPSPPARYLVPGDMCWQDQGQTNNCGPFSFSTVMNYWMPYTNNPVRKDGALYAQPGNVDDFMNGARTPANIVEAAPRFRMSARDNDAEELSRAQAMKLLKLWIKAGVPVMVLVEEEYNVWSLHWKVVVGYDGDRVFMNNSGADNEVVLAKRDPGVIYERAPVGNDVDSQTAHFNKWKSAGGDAVDLLTSVDECTFIPMLPNDPMFSGDRPR